MIAMFAVADEFVSERDYLSGFALIGAIADKAQCGRLRVRMISYTFGGGARLRIQITSRAPITARVLLSGLLQHFVDGLRIPFNREVSTRRKIYGVCDVAIPLDLADQPPDSFE